MDHFGEEQKDKDILKELKSYLWYIIVGLVVGIVILFYPKFLKVVIFAIIGLAVIAGLVVILKWFVQLMKNV